LPIELLYFEGTYDNNMVKLIWASITELNNDYFVIEYSVNATDWNVLAHIDGAGNSVSEHKYLYMYITDNSYYYQLSQVDYDGKKTYFNVIFVNSSPLNDDLEYEVYDNMGKFIITGKKVEIIDKLHNNKIYMFKSKYNCEKIIINQ